MEALVTLGAASLILVLLTWTVVLCHRRFRALTARHDGQSQLLLASQRLSADVRRAPVESLRVHYPSGDPAQGDLVLSMLTPLTTSGGYQRNAQGELLYQAWSIYHRPAGGGVRWMRVPLSTPTSTAAPQALSDLLAALVLPGQRTLVQAPIEFRLLDPEGLPSATATDPLRIQLLRPGLGSFSFLADPPG